MTPSAERRQRLGETMRIAVISGGEGWHVCDLRRAAHAAGHTVEVLDFRRLRAAVGVSPDPFPPAPAVVVRTMPPGSLEQVIFRMDVLQRWQAQGVTVLNSPRSLEICI